MKYDDEIVSSLDKSSSYILRDPLPTRAYSMMSKLMDGGYAGLCITRMHPSDAKIDLHDSVKVIWLSTTKEKGVISTTELQKIKQHIQNFLEKNKSSVVLFDRVDYLVNMHGFAGFLRMVYSINDLVKASNAIMIMNADENALEPKEITLLERELEELPSMKSKLQNDLNDDLYQLLTFVNGQTRTTFKNIGKTLEITKTTTRKRINKLVEMDLLSVDKNGRNKIVQVTDKVKGFL